MFGVNKKTNILAGFLLLLISLNLFSPVLLKAQATIEASTTVSAELRIVPTTLTVTPATATAAEGSAAVPFKAIAHYDYPGLVDPIPDKDVSADSLTTWSSSAQAVALVNTIGSVTPVSDLNVGSATSNIQAVYGGISGVAVMTVTGQIPSSGNGGGGSVIPPVVVTPPVVTPPPVVVTPPVVSPPSTGGDTPPVVNPPSTGGDTPPVVNPPSTGGDTPPVVNPPSIPGVTGDLPKTVFDKPIDSPYLPLDQPVLDNEIKPVETQEDKLEQTGMSRAIVAARIADKLHILELRKSLLARCYADLSNCTNIFRMYSHYQGIKLDPDNLRLFPDLEDNVNKDKINKLALLSVVQGYYGIEDSPFLPDKSISNVETLKILTTVLSALEKSKEDYVPQQFDYNSLFYQEIYAASLLNGLSKVKKAAAVPVRMIDVVKVAHAISSEGWSLIKKQSTPFVDVRPDLYDSHWYYPIVYKRVCELELIDCKEGSAVYPDNYPTSAQVDKMISAFAVYLKKNGIDQAMQNDTDNDGIANVEENAIYLTDPRVADTDKDGLFDGQEINNYKTDPLLEDTDVDLLTDAQEVDKYKTNPLLADTDGDGFFDGDEVKSGSNPLDKKSVPDDKNNNQISDAWELKFGVDVKNGSQDTDGDGLADILEYQYGSDPTKIDSDSDGFTDQEEVMLMHTDPMDSMSPGDLKNMPVIINNIQYGQVIADPSPMIRGLGPVSLADNVVKVQVILRNEFGSELVLGETQTDAKGGFVFVPNIEIKDGTYYLLARAIDRNQVKLSSPLKITIDSKLKVSLPKPEKIESTPVTEEALVKDVILKVDSVDERPVLYGTLTEFGSRVNVTWQSLVVSSALMTDTTDGSFSVKAPLLPEGRHTVYIQAVRGRDKAMSRTIKISFDLSKSSVSGKGVAQKLGDFAKNLNFSAVLSDQSWLVWVVVVVVIVLIVGGIYFFSLSKEDKNRQQKG